MSSRARTLANFGDGIATADIGDGQITTAKIADGDVTSAKLFSGFANGITQADIFRLTSNKSLTQNVTSDITANLERADDATSGLLGSGMSESSGVFTFPETGVYLVSLFAVFERTGNGASRIQVNVNVSTDSGANYDQVATGESGLVTHSSTTVNHGSCSSFVLVDVTNASTFRIKFAAFTDSNGVNVAGNTDSHKTAFSFIRLGDT